MRHKTNGIDHENVKTGLKSLSLLVGVGLGFLKIRTDRERKKKTPRCVYIGAFATTDA